MSVRPAPWRIALVLSAVLAPLGGRLHPEADASGTVRSELAEMTAHHHWVPSHLMLFASAALLALGLALALRASAFTGVRTALRVAAAAAAVSAVEMGIHLAAVVDSDHLAHGEAAPVAMLHVVLTSVVAPLFAVTVLVLSLRLADEWSGARKLIAVPGVVGALLHGAAVPVTLLMPDTETSPLFASASLTLALWALLLAAVAPRARRAGAGRPSADTEPRREVVAAG